MDLTTYIYIVDNNDIIISVSDNWLYFVGTNEGSERCYPENTIGQSIQSFISGAETKLLYKIIIDKVRESKQPQIFPFRCDSPDTRRYLEMNIHPFNKNNFIEFRSTVRKIEPREPINLLKPSIRRSNEIIKMCCMCKDIQLSNVNQVDVEKAIYDLELFHRKPLPRISHVICPPCYEKSMIELNVQKRTLRNPLNFY